MPKPFVAPIALLALLPAALTAGPPRASEVTNQARASQGVETSEVTIDDEKVVCRRDRIIGSRLTTKRMCLTEAQWARKDAETRETVEKIQNARWKSS